MIITLCVQRLSWYSKKHQSKKSSRVKYDTAKLENEDYFKSFTISLNKRYQVLENRRPTKEENEEVERDYKIIKKSYTETAKANHGRRRRSDR